MSRLAYLRKLRAGGVLYVTRQTGEVLRSEDGSTEVRMNPPFLITVDNAIREELAARPCRVFANIKELKEAARREAFRRGIGPGAGWTRL